MIEKCHSYKTQDGHTFADLNEAKKHELAKLLNIDAVAVLTALVDNAEAVVSILKYVGRKPRTRKAAKKAKTAPQAA